jgi:hypothetical protein
MIASVETNFFTPISSTVARDAGLPVSGTFIGRPANRR